MTYNLLSVEMLHYEQNKITLKVNFSIRLSITLKTKKGTMFTRQQDIEIFERPCK